MLTLRKILTFIGAIVVALVIGGVFGHLVGTTAGFPTVAEWVTPFLSITVSWFLLASMDARDDDE